MKGLWEDLFLKKQQQMKGDNLDFVQTFIRT